MSVRQCVWVEISPVNQMQPTEWTGPFLECGILARGFLRLRCGDCGHDKLVAKTRTLLRYQGRVPVYR